MTTSIAKSGCALQSYVENLKEGGPLHEGWVETYDRDSCRSHGPKRSDGGRVSEFGHTDGPANDISF